MTDITGPFVGGHPLLSDCVAHWAPKRNSQGGACDGTRSGFKVAQTLLHLRHPSAVAVQQHHHLPSAGVLTQCFLRQVITLGIGPPLQPLHLCGDPSGTPKWQTAAKPTSSPSMAFPALRWWGRHHIRHAPSTSTCSHSPLPTTTGGSCVMHLQWRSFQPTALTSTSA